jgi:hypothetical protein
MKIQTYDRYIYKFFIIIFLSFLVILCIVVSLPFFSSTTFKADRNKQHLDLSLYGVDKDYKIQFYASIQHHSEIQASNYFCIAANNLGIDCQVIKFHNFGYFKFIENCYLLSQNLITKFIQPNLIIDMTPFSHKKIESSKIYYFTHAALHEESFVKKPTFDYDGYIIYGRDDTWLKIKNKNQNKKIITGNYIGALKKDFIDKKRNYLIHAGSNWDNKRGSYHYHKIFKLLDQKDYFQVHGTKLFWRFLKDSYKGYIKSLDDLSNRINAAGISLILHSHYHWKNNEPSSARIFEATSCGNIIISDNLPIIKEMFGDSIFYIDPMQDPEKVVQDIDNIVNWVKNNQDEANKKAKKSYDIFINNYSSEKTILNIIKNL